MGTRDVREAIRGQLPRVAIEAPAGCGKTHEASEGSLSLARELFDEQELLLLAHTNAAVGEFRQRVRGAGVRVRASTLDAFALELVTPYGKPLGLPTPITPGDGAGQVPFADLARKAAELLRRAPTLARSLGRHYPVIFVDEHQDSRVDQYEFVDRIVRAGNGRLRTLADPMQAIYGFDDLLVDWNEHCRGADRVEQLDEPHRWQGAAELGAWIMESREALRSGESLPLRALPECVNVVRVPQLRDAPPPASRRVQPALLVPLSRFAQRLDGSLAVLTRYNEHVRGLNSSLRGRVIIQEGADLGPAYTALEKVEAAHGDPKAMAMALVDLLSATCTGVTAQLRGQLSTSLLPDRLDFGRRQRVHPVLECLEPLYTDPTPATWCRALASVLARPPSWLKVDLRLNLRILSHLRPQGDEDTRRLLDEASRRYREGALVPRRCVSTIHKAKGQEYDHVIVVHCSGSVFRDDDEGRRLLYTALSRAKTSVTILVPEEEPSPLVA